MPAWPIFVNCAESRKNERSPRDEASCHFEASLAHYMAKLQLPLYQADYVQELIKEHDFSSARAHLVPSVPGEHSGEHSSTAWNRTTCQP